LVPLRRRHRLAHGLFRREFPPADNRNHDPNQRRDRTTDGPGCGVAHLATAKHSESLECPDQTEHCEDQPDRECNDESPSHIGILRAIWSLRSMPHTDLISRFVADNLPGAQRGRTPVGSMAGDQVRPRFRSPGHHSLEHCLARRGSANRCGTVKSRCPSPIIAGFVIAAFCRNDVVRRRANDGSGL
jgi:hypothetical protein